MSGPERSDVTFQRSWPRAVWFVVPAAVVAVGLLIVFAASDSQRNQPGQGRLRGEVVPAVMGETLDGEHFDIDDQRGRWVVVNFFASWCPPCRSEHPELATFVERHAGGDAVLVGVAVNDRRDDVEAFVDELGGGWPLLVDDTTSVVIDFAVTAPPTTFLVSPAGVIVEEFIGEVTADGLDDTIAFYEAAAEEAPR